MENFISKLIRTINMIFDKSDITLEFRFKVIQNIWKPNK